MYTEQVGNNTMNKDIVKACSLCEFAECTVSEEMICLKRGPVSADHCCRKFRYDPFKRIPPAKKKLSFETEIEPL